MISKEHLFSHQEELLVLCLPQNYESEPLVNFSSLIDWYNNQLLTKSLAQKKISLALGSLTLLKTNELLLTKKILVYGLGKLDRSDESDTFSGTRMAQDLSRIISDLKVQSVLIAFDQKTSSTAAEQFDKARTSLKQFAGVNIIVS